jgi:phytoene dehydrogenase-like protein
LTDLFVCPDFSCTSLFFILAGWHIGGTGYPQGSTLALAKTIERTFLDMNGKIEYRKKVKRIIVQDSQAIGIELDDGAVEKANIIISAADGHATLFDMLEDRFTTLAQRERFATKPLYSSFIQVSLGVNRDMSAEPHAIKVQVPVPYEIAGQSRQVLWFHHFAFDSTMAPRGKSSLTVLYPTTLAWWEHLDYQSKEYDAEKNVILATTIAQLEQVLPGISSQIEASDVATPFTMIRYTNNWKAAPGFMMTKDLAGEMTMNPQYALPGLDNFYMTGQWVKGFGVPMAAMSGKEVIQEICKAEGRKFVVA